MNSALALWRNRGPRLPGLALPLLAIVTAGCALLGPSLTLRQPRDGKNWRMEGAWDWSGEWLGGKGGKAWRYAAAGADDWKNYRVEAKLRIAAASDRREPKWDPGCAWANYRNHAAIAGYEAGLLLRRQGKDFYRVMFSAAWQEIVLWSPKGGFLQVVPWKLTTGEVYRLKAEVCGPRITLALNEQPVFVYWDRTAPLRQGGVALGLCDGEATFSGVRVTPLLTGPGKPPPHQPDLRFREWKGERWAWDGREPLFSLGTDCNGHDLKLAPGYKPQMLIFWHWLNYGDESFYADKLREIKVQEEGSTLRFEVIATDNKEKNWLTSRTGVTVTYDAANTRYIYDHVSDLTIAAGHSLRVNHPLEFTDPCIHGHVGSASPATIEWETPHPWSVYKHLSGKLYKQPHNHAIWYSGYGSPAWQEAKGNYLAPDGGFWAVVGDPAVNPVMTVTGSSVKDAKFYTELCGWAFDVHMRWIPVKPGESLQPGTYTVNWQLTTVAGAQSDRWLAEAQILAPDDPEKKLLLYTAGIGRVEPFNTVAKWASPFYTHPLGDASLQDATVGHTDSTSVKLVGPAAARSVVGASQYADAVLEDTLYEVSAWVRTRQVQGDGPGLEFGGQRYFPLITGTTDWQRIGFVCKPNQPLHTVNFALINSGSGTVWFDDFLIRPLAKDEKPAPPIAAGPKPVAWPDAAPDKLLEWAGAGDTHDPGRTLLDLSRHGQHGRLEGTAAMVDDSGCRALALESDKGWATGGNFTFPPPLSFTVWVKPGKLVNDWNMIAVGGAWNRAWNLFLFYKQSPYSIDFRPWGKRFFVDAAVPQDKWTHIGVTDDGKMVRIYVNGTEAKAEASGGAAWAMVEGPLTLGTWLYYEKPKSGFNGALANPIVWSKALSAAEMKTVFEQGRK